MPEKDTVLVKVDKLKWRILRLAFTRKWKDADVIESARQGSYTKLWGPFYWLVAGTSINRLKKLLDAALKQSEDRRLIAQRMADEYFLALRFMNTRGIKEREFAKWCGTKTAKSIMLKEMNRRKEIDEARNA